MNATEIEALLFRMQDAYPQAAAPRQGTPAEWRTSTVGQMPAAVVFAAFDGWRDNQDWPPTMHQLYVEAQEVARRFADEQRALESAERQRHLDGTQDTFECYRCQDRGWILVPVGPDDDGSGPELYMPCSKCRPKTYELWSGGHFKPNHVCTACVDRARGRTTRASH